ncbi:MAG: 50S ribosomal protein L30 [Candidatus Eisenbacteria bacterium RBG_16_71_46]|nr:MAG: 50S ribosomal protein L30 [Candidatus Eisenbacteria bacterium RBG_16_71_46]OGF24579.1 MAG: 50S ribosomal protein L30 [Candidatus Eisenbacteria bacterium RBG_19FT_COMBO_70_11]
MARKLRIQQIKSASGHPADQGATVRALGIRRMQQAIEHDDTPQIRGMVFKVRHLVRVEEIR